MKERPPTDAENPIQSSVCRRPDLSALLPIAFFEQAGQIFLEDGLRLLKLLEQFGRAGGRCTSLNSFTLTLNDFAPLLDVPHCLFNQSIQVPHGGQDNAENGSRTFQNQPRTLGHGKGPAA